MATCDLAPRAGTSHAGSLRGPAGRRPFVRAAAVVAVAGLLVLTGCGGDDEEGGATSTSAGDATSTSAADDLTVATGLMDEAEVVDKTAEAAVTVNVRDNYFDPKYVEVRKGTTITFINDGRNVHDVLPVADVAFAAIPSEAFDPGAQGQVIFDEAGAFPYYCSLHGSKTKGMIGGVRVVE